MPALTDEAAMGSGTASDKLDWGLGDDHAVPVGV